MSPSASSGAARPTRVHVHPRTTMRLLPVMAAAVAIVSAATSLPGQQTPYWITPEAARDLERRNALPVTPFYDTVVPLSHGASGTLIRTEEFGKYDFPGGISPEAMAVRCVRILYRSRAVDGGAVPASGVVLVPYGEPPTGGWPVVAWAHGTSGVGRFAAPSLMKDLYYGWEGLLQWVMLGYAVVAPDYAGLGTSVPHQYLAFPAQAWDVINAVHAARAALPQLGHRWVAVGHSQGGGAVLAVAEIQDSIRDPGYLGAIAVAPGSDLQTDFERITRTQNHGYAAFLAYGIRATYPDFRYEDFLTPEALALMPVVNEGAWYTTLATFAQRIPVGKLLRPNWRENAHFQRLRRLSAVGEHHAYQPVLLIQGLADSTVTTTATDALYTRMRQQRTAVEYMKYPGLDHDPVVYGSFRDQLRWVQRRFTTRAEGRPVQTGARPR